MNTVIEHKFGFLFFRAASLPFTQRRFAVSIPPMLSTGLVYAVLSSERYVHGFIRVAAGVGPPLPGLCAAKRSQGELGRPWLLACSLLIHRPRILQGRSVMILYKPDQATDAYLQGTASTLTRGEVRGGGRKPYKQKGSGNARRGSKRSPLMPGGGISFGPKVGVAPVLLLSGC